MKMVQVGVLLVVVALMPVVQVTQETLPGDRVPSENVWAVKLNSESGESINSWWSGSSRVSADTVASELELINRGRIEPFKDVFQFELSPTGVERGRYTRDLVHYEMKLKEHSAIVWSSKQRPLKRTKRELHGDVNFNDPFYRKQWHLVNHREVGHDINVTGVWLQNVTGRGVVISVVDDGVEHSNKDLYLNYNAEGSYDLNSRDHDPSPRLKNPRIDNTHGTKCAGLIAAIANNSVCAVGVAHGAQVSGIRMLDGTVTDILEGQSFIYKAHVNSIYSCSWGPDDNGKTMEGPGRLASEALYLGTSNGRYGYGNIYVFASGNGGSANDNCNFDGYANSIYSLTVGAVDEVNSMPYYAEPCPSMLAVTYSNGRAHVADRSITTTDTSTHGGCTKSFTGTSAAAPIASGIVALMLEVRPCLSWRDVQAIVVYSAVKVDAKKANWVGNGAGFHHSDQHGFGLMDAYRLSVTAAVWPLLPAMVTWSASLLDHQVRIPTNKEWLNQTVVVASDELPEDLNTLEYIAVTVTLSHECRGAVEISLQSPTGTQSTLITTRRYDDSSDGLDGWTLTSARFWGESPNGTWTLSILDHITMCSNKNSRGGVLKAWRLTLYGSKVTTNDVKFRQQLVEDAVSNGSLESALPCPPLPIPNDIHLSESSYSILTWQEVLIAIGAILVLVLFIHFTLECVVKRFIAWKRRRKLLHSAGPVLFVRGEEGSGGECEESDSEETALLINEDETTRGVDVSEDPSREELKYVFAVDDSHDAISDKVTDHEENGDRYNRITASTSESDVIADRGESSVHSDIQVESQA